MRRAIAAGRIARPEEAVAEAFARWIEMERQRDELIASLDEADVSDRRGESIIIDGDKDLVGIASSIAQHETPAVADAILDRIKERCRLVGRYPSVGRSRDDDLGVGRRTLPSGRFIIACKRTASGVLIERIIDGRRDYPAAVRPVTPPSRP